MQIETLAMQKMRGAKLEEYSFSRIKVQKIAP